MEVSWNSKQAQGFAGYTSISYGTKSFSDLEAIRNALLGPALTEFSLKVRRRLQTKQFRRRAGDPYAQKDDSKALFSCLGARICKRLLSASTKILNQSGKAIFDNSTPPKAERKVEKIERLLYIAFTALDDRGLERLNQKIKTLPVSQDEKRLLQLGIFLKSSHLVPNLIPSRRAEYKDGSLILRKQPRELHLAGIVEWNSVGKIDEQMGGVMGGVMGEPLQGIAYDFTLFPDYRPHVAMGSQDLSVEPLFPSRDH